MGNVFYVANNSDDNELVDADLPVNELRRPGHYMEYCNSMVSGVGLVKDFQLSNQFNEKLWFGRMTFLVVDQGIFKAKDKKAIESRLGRQLEREDCICIRHPKTIKDGQLLPQQVFVARVFSLDIVH